ncbi:S8 family serine peptidase [Actinokineospora soli]|uniref:S8 family serine peptidase n=1 Tax=Actinokineospora soli TaxID=1048753 RepID=A0ABW2TMY0_9PSEU
MRATLDRSVPQIGAPAAWSAGHTGAGTTVAVLDTGIDETHPDLVGAVAGARNFSGSDTTDDRFGHGTHVAATVTGDGRYKGVAPDAKLLNGKVLDDNGGGTESDIIAGMEWAAAEGADVVNMSLGSPFPSDGTDPMSQAVNRITAETGALFVIAAGNSGPGEQSIGSPAAADAALTVGAVDRDGAIADFSSRGPRIKDGAIKPDITAPGVGIVAAKAANGIIGDPVGDKHVALSGTSMAAPHVAGAAALLAGQHPDWSAEQLKAVLVASAAPNPALSVYDQGAGLVDVARATRQPVSASPASVGLGTARWPHGDDEPIVRKLTYRNSGTEPLTLRVAVDLRDEAGKPATLVTVAPSEVTIPAGGQADVTLTANTRLDAPDGRYSGVVTATGGDTAVRTPVGLDKEVESYDVELTFLDHDGKPTPEYFYRFVDLRKPKAHVDHDPSGKLTARVPKGTYYFDAFIQTPRDGEGLWPLANFNEAGITITGDTALTLDARAGTPLDVTVDRAEARSGYAATFFTMTTDWGDTGSGIVGNDFSGITFAPSRTTAPARPPSPWPPAWPSPAARTSSSAARTSTASAGPPTAASPRPCRSTSATATWSRSAPPPRASPRRASSTRWRAAPSPTRSRSTSPAAPPGTAPSTSRPPPPPGPPTPPNSRSTPASSPAPPPNAGTPRSSAPPSPPPLGPPTNGQAATATTSASPSPCSPTKTPTTSASRRSTPPKPPSTEAKPS